jgi:hypothetical protein
MSLAKAFDRELKSLFERRTAWLHRALGKKQPGRPHEFTKKKVGPKLYGLGEIAAQILVRRRARKDFNRSVDRLRQWHVKRGKGHGVRAKKESFREWYDKKIGHRNCVYVFWAKRDCVYVGRTSRGKSRPVGWFDRYWFSRVTRIDIHTVHRRSEVPKVECLAIHLFDPAENENWPSIGKYTKKCPICKTTKDIDAELKNIFRLR